MPLSQSAVVELQRTVGNRAVTPLLRRGPEVAIQRRILDGDAILAGVPAALAGNALESEGGALSLDSVLHGDTTLKDRIDAILSTYEAQFVTDKPDAVTTNAMKILAALGEVGRIVARRLHLAQEAPVITQALLESQKDRITAALMATAPKSAPEEEQALSGTDAGAVMEMAETLAGDDPVGKFVQGKLPLRKAEARIRQMAKALGQEPLAIFELLRQQFESRIGSLTLADVKAQEVQAPKGYMFPLKDLYGEVSVNFFTNLVALNSKGEARWGSTGMRTVPKKDRESWEEGSGSGAHTFEVADIDQLRLAVSRKAEEEDAFAITSKSQKAKGWDRLNVRQMEYLSGLDAMSGGDLESRARLALLQHFTLDRELDPVAAEEMLRSGVTNLRTQPITLTTKAQDMLLPSGQVVDEYKPFFSVFMQRKGLDEALPNLGVEKEIRLVEDVLGRGLDYGQYRMEKDDDQIGDSPLSVEDLPAMACVNYAFARNPGPNYYGDTHFVLRPEVRKRSVLSFGTGSPERRSEILLLHDVLQKDTKKLEQLCDGTYGQQDIEVHVYGNIKLREDVKTFHLGNPNMLTDADTRGGKGMQNVPGTPTEKLMTLRAVMDQEDIERLADIWVEKQQGTEKLRELIASLNIDEEVVDSNLGVIGETREVDVAAVKGPLPPPPQVPVVSAEPKGKKRKKGKGKCYITTACVRSRGLADDCQELQVLRDFRDGYLLAQPGGPHLVDFYYDQSPQIVASIDGSHDPVGVYAELYAVILECVDAITNQRPEEAFATYVRMVLGLRDTYAPHMEVPDTISSALAA